MEDKDINNINSYLKELFEKLDVEHFDIETTFDPEENLLSIEIEGSDLGNVIGYHGENVFSLQSIIYSYILRNIEGEYSLFVDIGGYRKDREEKLRENATAIASKISKMGGTHRFPPMKPAERRVLHTEIAKLKDVVSYSVGEGFDRRVVISKSELNN